jgi:hypothetical protein
VINRQGVARCAPIGDSTTVDGPAPPILVPPAERSKDPQERTRLNVGLDRLDDERELLQDLVEEPDRGGLREGHAAGAASGYGFGVSEDRRSPA